jgi:hypothetical protein
MIYIVSQLAIGDAYLCRKFIVDELVRLKEEVCVICNPNNSFVFNGVPTIVENWPLSPRRFKSFQEFKYLFSPCFIKRDDIILIPSGYFTEKMFAFFRFCYVKKIFFVRIQNGLRAKKNNMFFGKYFKTRYQINIKSSSAYAAHVECFSKFFFQDRNLNRIKKDVNNYIDLKCIKEIYIQISATVKTKSISKEFLEDLIFVFKDLNCRLRFIQDSVLVENGDSIDFVTPQDVCKNHVTNNAIYFLLDSYLLHFMSDRLKNVFCITSEIYANDWLPANGHPVSSIYSFYLWVQLHILHSDSI